MWRQQQILFLLLSGIVPLQLVHCSDDVGSVLSSKLNLDKVLKVQGRGLTLATAGVQSGNFVMTAYDKHADLAGLGALELSLNYLQSHDKFYTGSPGSPTAPP